MGSADFQKRIYESQDNYFKGNLKDDYPRIKQIHKFMKKVIGSSALKILDVGCASGEITSIFSPKNHIYGVDISGPFLAEAKKNGLTVKEADLEKEIPFPSSTFDMALCSEVIEHVVDTDKLLSEINRVIKKNGDLILTIPNINSVISYPMMFFFDLPPYLSSRYRGPHVRDFTLKTIKLALENNGFKIINYTGSSFFIPPFGNMGKVGEILGSVFPRFSRIIVIHAKKQREAKYVPEKSFALRLY